MTVLTPAKQVVHSLFNMAGLEIHKRRPADAAPPLRDSIVGVLNHLRNLGFRPRTVIDVGVATQTHELYDCFRESKIILVEPLAEFEPFLQRIGSNYDARYVLAAAGEMDGTVVLNVHPDMVGSSLLKEVEGSSVDGSPREVPMVTIDSVCAVRELGGPYLIKVDVQGAELQVLAGAVRVLNQTEVVILEVSLFGALIGGPQLWDVVTRMKELGFVVYDLYGNHYRPLDAALWQVDVVFVRENGPFRSSQRYATAEQRKELLKLHLAYVQRDREKR